MLPGVHGGIEHTYIHHGGGVVVLYYVRLSVRTLLYFVHAVLFCPNLLCFCLLFCFSLALHPFFAFAFAIFFSFLRVLCVPGYRIIIFFALTFLWSTRVRTHRYPGTQSLFKYFKYNKIKSLIFKKTHKVPVQYLFEPTFSFFYYFLIFLHRLSFFSFLFFFVRLGWFRKTPSFLLIISIPDIFHIHKQHNSPWVTYGCFKQPLFQEEICRCSNVGVNDTYL